MTTNAFGPFEQSIREREGRVDRLTLFFQRAADGLFHSCQKASQWICVTPVIKNNNDVFWFAESLEILLSEELDVVLHAGAKY